MDEAEIEEAVQFIGDRIMALAKAVYPIGAIPATDGSGGVVHSLTEAVMGVTAGLFAIASAIDGLSDSVAASPGPEKEG